MKTAAPYGKRCVIYSRYSNISDKETGEVSLNDQQQVNQRWALENGFTDIVEAISETISGARSDRAGMSRCLELAKTGLIDAVICYDFKRFSRLEELESAALLYQFKQAGVRVLFATEPNGEDLGTQVLMALRRIFSPMDKDDIKKRMVRGKVRSLEQRNRVLGGGRRPFGLKYLPKPDYRYELVPEEAEWIERMAAMCMSGQSLYKIAQTLTANGIRTTTGKDRWGVTSVKSVLSNPLYTGTFYYFRHTFVEPKRRFNPETRYLKTTSVKKDESEWMSVSGSVSVNGHDVDLVPQILTPETHEAVQAALRRNADRSQRNCRREYLLRGMARCAVCGRRLVGQTGNTGKGRAGTRYYWCYSSQSRPQDDPSIRCTVRGIPADALERRVWDEVIRQVSDEEVITANLQARETETDTVREQLRQELSRVEESEKRIKKDKGLLFDLLRDGDVDRDIYNDRLYLLRKDEATVQKVRTNVEAEMKAQENAHASLEDVRRLAGLVQLGLPLVGYEAKREFLDALEVVVRADKQTVQISGLIQDAILSMMSGESSHNLSRLHSLTYSAV